MITENPYSRMPVYEGSIDHVVGILHRPRDRGRPAPRRGPSALHRHLKPAYFVPEGMKISRLLKEMQRRRTHLAIVVDEFGGTSGLVTLEDVIEEIVGEIQDEADVEAAPVKEVAPGVWLADAAIPLHDLESFLNERTGGQEPGRERSREPIRFPEGGDYETLGGFVTVDGRQGSARGRHPDLGRADLDRACGRRTARQPRGDCAAGRRPGARGRAGRGMKENTKPRPGPGSRPGPGPGWRLDGVYVQD